MAEIRARAALHAGGGGEADRRRGRNPAQRARPGPAHRADRGWPAGVYLAAISLRDHPSPHAFIRQFTGNNRFIVDFLAEEVLSRQPPEIQQFLARTSLLARFCAPRATPSPASRALRRSSRCSNERTCSSCHWTTTASGTAIITCSRSCSALLARTEPALLTTLHERASAWHEEAGQPEEAVEHALPRPTRPGGAAHRPLLARLRRQRPGGDGQRMDARARR